MSGIERITAEIRNEAQSRADALLSDARKKAEEALAAANADADSLLRDAVEKAGRDADDLRNRAVSQADLERRQTLLAARQEVIREVIDKAYAKLDQLPEGEYFSMLERLLEKNVQGADGEICLSARDRARMPAAFPEKAAAIAKKHGGSLALAADDAAIENGFVLRYGGIEENCSLSAIFASQKESMQDLVHRALWQ